MSVEEVLEALNAAKTNRLPIVVDANLAMEEGEKNSVSLEERYSMST